MVRLGYADNLLQTEQPLLGLTADPARTSQHSADRMSWYESTSLRVCVPYEALLLG